MSSFVRYPFLVCVILSLSACSSSGSSKLLEPATSATGSDEPGSTVQETYSSVEYLITDIPGAIAKFASMDTSEDDMEGMDEDEMPDDDNTASTDSAEARALTSTPAQLTALRNTIVSSSSRYLSTGAVLARTDDDNIVTERPDATCSDQEITPGHAQCVFAMDTLREATTFHLGPGSSGNRVSFREFEADREPVMVYRDTLLSQVRTSNPGSLLNVYEDSGGERYLLTDENVEGMDLDDVTLPDGVTTPPAFADLLAVYKDADDNEYRLTATNITDMNLDDVTLPEGVTEDSKPSFEDLTRVTERDNDGYEYVGYDGMLEHSMFFVGVYRFFDDDGMLEHTRFENASLGSIYDNQADESGVQNPGVALTGEGVMVGMERQKDNLESHLVQGDVNIMYDPSVAADPAADPPVFATDAMLDISITNIQRLADDDDAWYATSTRLAGLSWTDLMVADSKFSHTPTDDDPLTEDKGTLSGSFYGTEDDIEIGGVFHHESILYEIIGSFGSKLSEREDDEDDMTDPMQ